MNTCQLCGTPFKPTANSKGLYCSNHCSAIVKGQRRKELAAQKYLDNPVPCEKCGKTLTRSQLKSKQRFCSKRCSALINSPGRKQTEETKQKISESLKRIPTENKKAYYERGLRTRVERSPTYSYVRFKVCTVCEKPFIVKTWKQNTRKTCSRECQIHASVGNRTYLNGKRLNIYYFNKNENKEILLESSWELEIAKFLDLNEVVWVRPKPIRYELEDKSRLYYPDFYLPDFNLYLDPKNPHVILQSKSKMEIVEKLIPLVYGSLEIIKEAVSRRRAMISQPSAPRADALPT